MRRDPADPLLLAEPTGLEGRRLACLVAVGALLYGAPAFAWGDRGHEIIGLVADHYLEPDVRGRMNAILATDRSRLSRGTDIAAQATWADKYRDSDRHRRHWRYDRTRTWHYINLELEAPDLRSACYGLPPLPHAVPASQGPAADCVVNKIDEFVRELGNLHTPPAERLTALQFVLHLVGDVHQPLHASDSHDAGGNQKTVSSAGVPTTNLHAAWDKFFVERLGTDVRATARSLTARITAAERTSWSGGRAADWAQESFRMARDHAYGRLPPPGDDGTYELPEDYITDATAVTAQQLSKAGVRLAYILNRALR